jgi:predicted nuclease with TOPRIM domain
LLCAFALLLWHARYHLHVLVIPSLYMLAGGGIVHILAVKPLKAQLRVVVDEHNTSQTHQSNFSAENEQLRQTEALLGGENSRLQEDIKRLQGLADEYKAQYERQAEISARLQQQAREGIPPEAHADAVQVANDDLS